MPIKDLKISSLIFLLFAVAACVLTYPLVFKIQTHIPGFFSTDESYGILRKLWWHKYAYLNHISYRQDTLLAFPFGYKYPALFIYPLWELFSKWLTLAVSEVFAYNSMVFLSYVLSGMFVYALVYYLNKNRLAAFFSGLAYASCPYFFARIWQHFGLAQIQWMPLCLLALVVLYKRRDVKAAVWFGLSLFLLFSFDDQYAFFIFIAALVFILYLLFYRWKEKIKKASLLKNDLYLIRMLLLAGVIALILSLPSILIIMKDISSYSGMQEVTAHNLLRRPFEDLFTQSARPLSYFLPAAVHPFLGKLTGSMIGNKLYGMSFTEHTLYLGWVPLAMTFVAFRRWKKRNKLSVVSCQLSDNEMFYIGYFIFLAIVSWVFSQPPWWQIGPLKIYMPSFFIYKVLPMFRAYCRFGILLMLSVSVLSGFGMKLVLERFNPPPEIPGLWFDKLTIPRTIPSEVEGKTGDERGFGQRRREPQVFSGRGGSTSRYAAQTAAVLCCALVLFEFWNYPPARVIDLTEVPAVYRWLKSEPGDFAIAEYPLDAESPDEMFKFYQTKHAKKMVNGTTPGTYANSVARALTKLSRPDTASALKWLGVKYVLVHAQGYKKTDTVEAIEELNAIARNPGIRLKKIFDGVNVYEITAEPKEPAVES